jgi:hypothetical protein
MPPSNVPGFAGEKKTFNFSRAAELIAAGRRIAEEYLRTSL